MDASRSASDMLSSTEQTRPKPKRSTYAEAYTHMKRFHRSRDTKRREEAERKEQITEMVRRHIKEPKETLPDIYNKMVMGLQSMDLGKDPENAAIFKRVRQSRSATNNFTLPFVPVKPIVSAGAARKGFDSRSRTGQSVSEMPKGSMVSSLPARSDDFMSDDSGSTRREDSICSEDVPDQLEQDSASRHARSIKVKPPNKIVFKILHKVEALKDDGPITVEWLNERLATSCRSCRFELPMDMRSLEKMSVQEYLLKYCKISNHRMNAYNKVYNKYKNKTTGTMSVPELETTLCTLLIDTVALEDIQKLTKALKFEKPNNWVDSSLFAVVCAVAERICYLSYICRHGTCGLGRGYLECADFSSLDWKLKNIKIDASLKRILYSLG